MWSEFDGKVLVVGCISSTGTGGGGPGGNCAYPPVIISGAQQPPVLFVYLL